MHLELRVHGTHRRHQRLAGDVAAESALQETGFGAEDTTAVDVDLDLLEVEDLLDRQGLPAAFGQAVRHRDVIDVDADHRLPSPRDTLANTSGSS